MWLQPCKSKGWRELLWSMSWLRPGGKFYKIHKHLSQDYHANLGFSISNKRNTRVRLKLPTNKKEEGKQKWQHQTK